MSLRTLAAAALAAPILLACSPSVQAPADPGVCWHMVQDKAGKIHFYKVAEGQPNLEHCAAALEAMRLHFLSLGGSYEEIDGAYQGQFLFLEKEGVFTAASLNTTPYLALVRTGDGRLAIPGAVQQGQ